jgi:hydrogenase maturation protein HypF
LVQVPGGTTTATAEWLRYKVSGDGNPVSTQLQIAKRILLIGKVQGVGLRPTLLRWAKECQIVGWLGNTSDGVELHVEGGSFEVTRFVDELPKRLPREAALHSMEEKFVSCEGYQSFGIRLQPHFQPLRTPVPADIRVCSSCLEEALHDSNRSGYAWNSCATCGPRYSLIKQMPFEREQTAMVSFPLCFSCCAEYDELDDHRSHAQTISCERCGPQMVLSGAEQDSVGQLAIERCVSAIRSGLIVALKGVGGYQLICDATQTSTVERLRQSKARPRKPLAIMVRDMTMAGLYADISLCEDVLNSSVGSIVLCPVRADSPLISSIHPGLSSIGMMLPTTALHAFLCRDVDRPLVVTSGNLEGEPLVYRDVEAQSHLAGICDLQLRHDRDIIRPIDDSVVHVIAGEPATIRLARGLAPLPLPVHITKQLCALGGQQKVAIALSNGTQTILGPHLGEMDSIATQQRFQEQYQSLCQLYDCQPSHLVHDLHPDSFTTRWADAQKLPTIAVQHHHAHIVSGMLENQWLDQTVLGFAFDGTGLGDDQTIWGGELLRCTARGYERIGSLRPFRLLGHEQAIRQPQRVALALLDELNTRASLSKRMEELNLTLILQPLLPLLDRSESYVKTSSMGRLFDGIAALVLSLNEASYEGEPAMRLEAICDTQAMGHYPLPFTNQQWDWRPLVQSVVNELLRGVDPGIIAMRVHRTVALAVVGAMEELPDMPVVLSGGCFQNKILVELILHLADDRKKIGMSRMIPVNDGGLAAGQLVIAAAQLKALLL